MPNPKLVLIMPDDALSGRNVVESVTSEADRFIGPVTLGASNDGDMLPSVYGSPTADFAIDIGIVRAGGPYRTAEWRWKNSTDGSTSWRGVDQVNWCGNAHDPFAGISGYRTNQCAVFAKRLNQMFCYWLTGSEQVLVRYRAAGGSPTSWSTASFTLTRPVVAISYGGIRVVELPDGALRMFVVYGHTGVADNDVDVYHSTDGLTWTLASRSVLSQSGAGVATIINMKAAVSGDWIRLVVMLIGTTQTYVSSDRGASFTQLSNLAVAIPSNGQTADAYSLCDIVGLDDYSGTFLMFYNTTLDDSVKLATAARDEDWAIPDAWTADIATDYNVYRIATVKTPTHVLALTVEWDGSTGSRVIGAVFVERNLAANGNPDDYRHFLISGINAADMMPRSVCGCEADGGAMILFGRCDPDTGGAEAEYGGCYYVQQWSGRSAWENEVIDDLTSEPYLQWHAILGDAGDFGSVLIPSTGASASRTWSSDYVRLKSDANGAGGASYVSMFPGATPKWGDGGNFLAEWVVRQPNGGSGAADDRTAIRIKGVGTTAGVSFDFSVRHLTSSVVVYDNHAARILATLSGLSLASGFYIGRACVTAYSGATWAEVAVCSVDQLGTGWSSAAGTLNMAAAGVTAQMVVFGNLAGNAGVTSDWRSFTFDRRADWGQAQFVNPTSLRGAPVSARPWYMASGAHVEFSGGAAFEFDTWSIETRHRHEIENLFMPSPQATWRSTSLVTQAIVFDAANVNRSSFRHAGHLIKGANMRRLRVAYNDTDSWGAPTKDTTLLSDLTSGLTVTAVDAGLRYVEVSGLTLDDGSYIGKWLHFTSGRWSGASITISSQSGQRLFFAAPGWTSVSPSTNDACVIHGDTFCTFALGPTSQRFMYLQVPQQTTAAGFHEIGSLVAGITIGFDDAEASWEHGLSVLNGVEITDGIGGVRWGFEASPPRRTWSFGVEDAVRKRQKWEAAARGLARLSVRPIGMVYGVISATGDLAKTAALVRFVGDVAMKNSGWRQQADGTWYEVGSLDLAFDEEL